MALLFVAPGDFKNIDAIEVLYNSDVTSRLEYDAAVQAPNYNIDIDSL